VYIHFGKLSVGVNLLCSSSRAKSFCGWTSWKLLKLSSMIAHSSSTSSRASTFNLNPVNSQRRYSYTYRNI